MKLLIFASVFLVMGFGQECDSLDQCQEALKANQYSSIAHFRIGGIYFLQRNYQESANQFREALNGDLDPKWTVVWAHIDMGKIYDVTHQRERALNEYRLALRTNDNTRGALDTAKKYLEMPYSLD